MSKFIPGKCYYFTPCALRGKERRENKIVAIANEVDGDRATFAVVGAVFSADIRVVDGSDLTVARIGDLEYCSSATVDASLVDAWRLKNAIVQSNKVTAGCGASLL